MTTTYYMSDGGGLFRKVEDPDELTFERLDRVLGWEIADASYVRLLKGELELRVVTEEEASTEAERWRLTL